VTPRTMKKKKNRGFAPKNRGTYIQEEGLLSISAPKGGKNKKTEQSGLMTMSAFYRGKKKFEDNIEPEKEIAKKEVNPSHLKTEYQESGQHKYGTWGKGGKKSSKRGRASHFQDTTKGAGGLTD